MISAEKRNFGFTRITWHEISPKLRTIAIEEILERAIVLSKYGPGLIQVYFAFQAVPYDSILYKEKTRFNKKKKQILLSLKLDYQKVVDANAIQIRQLMAELFLNSIDLYEKLGVKNFDIPAFKKDVEQLFRQQGWLNP